MCGILGIFRPGGVDRGEAKRLLDMLAHRGPDAEGFWESDDRRLILGHRRLKILDLSDAANQPMRSSDGRFTLVYNGEVVNYHDLRASYRGSWNFVTAGDTETLLALLAARGIDSLNDCVGMFAFALFDASLQRLTLVRDRFGIKPLYVTQFQDGGVAFASEIPPLLKLQHKVRADLDVVRTYLETALYETGRRTFFSGIESVAPGSAIEIDLDGGMWTERQWYSLARNLPDLSGASEMELIEEGARRIEQAIADHLIADVRTGLNVSGGVDSSTLVGVARRHVKDIHLFTQDYEPPYSEAEWVSQVAGDSPLHLEHLTEGHIRQVLDRTTRRQAEPFGGVTVAGYDYLYQAADREGVTVLLDGNGVDEIFLGYKKYHAAAVRLAGDEVEWMSLAVGYRHFWQSEPPPRGTNNFRGQSIDGSDGARPAAITDGLRRNSLVLSLPETGADFPDPIRAMAAQDLIATKIPRGLRFNDRMSMARSKELRVPFLDHRLVEFGFAVPRRHLLDVSGSKALFRRIAARWIPVSVVGAVKRSVQSPQREWLAGPWRRLVEEVLSSESFGARGWVDPTAAQRIYYQEYLAGRMENSFFLWQWLNLEWWARAFLDGQP
jgi:asparagine synthase (glutamine-hydrolysing)